jgi:SPP1 family predicted phage head-tail adaptor
MEAGKLTACGTIQFKTITQDTELNPIETWATFKANVWAEPLQQTSREFYRLSTNNSEITEVFRIRYTAGITARMHFVVCGRTLDIIGEPINEGERNVSLLLACKGIT